jgi:hypothetical protein
MSYEGNPAKKFNEPPITQMNTERKQQARLHSRWNYKPLGSLMTKCRRFALTERLYSLGGTTALRSVKLYEQEAVSSDSRGAASPSIQDGAAPARKSTAATASGSERAPPSKSIRLEGRPLPCSRLSELYKLSEQEARSLRPSGHLLRASSSHPNSSVVSSYPLSPAAKRLPRHPPSAISPPSSAAKRLLLSPAAKQLHHRDRGAGRQLSGGISLGER